MTIRPGTNPLPPSTASEERRNVPVSEKEKLIVTISKQCTNNQRVERTRRKQCLSKTKFIFQKEK